MPFTRLCDRQLWKDGARRAGLLSWRKCAWVVTCIAATVALAGAGPPERLPQSAPGSSEAAQHLVPSAKDVPTAPLESRAPGAQTMQPSSGAAGANRNRQIADESAELLKLATDLKAEVDKTTKDTLSMRVIRKAEEIRQLAHSVRSRVKQEGKPD